MSSDFHLLIPESFHKNLVQIGAVVFEKIRFDFLYVHDLGPVSRNDIDLQYTHIFIDSIRYLLLLTFRSLAAIVSEAVYHLRGNHTMTLYEKREKIRYHLRVWPSG